MGSFLALYMYDKIQKRRYLVCCLLFIVMAMLAQSRKSVLMVLMFIPLYIVLKSSKWVKIRNIVLICSLIIVFAYVVIENEALYEIIGKRIINLLLSFTGSTDYYDGSITERALMRKVAKQLTIQKPIFGWGANYFASYFKSYSIFGRYAYCHCNYLELMVSYGIVGAVLFYLPYVYVILKNIRGLRHHNKDSIFNIVFFMVLFVMEYGFVSYYEPLFHYTYKDLFATDSCLYFFSGHYDWKERLEKDVFFQVRLDYVKCRFEKTGYHWVAESQGKQFSMLRIVYIDGQKMIAIRWFDVPISITSSKALPYCLTFYRNEGSSEFLDSLIAYRNSHHY